MLVILISFAFAFGLLLSRLGLPPMVGFLLAGFAYHMVGLEQPAGLELVAQMGVTLLLFSIGLKLDVRGLAKAEIWGTSIAHMVISTAMMTGVLLVGKNFFRIPLLDLSLITLIILGFALSFSSTVFAVKILEDKGDLSAFYGKIAIGILIMQDIFAVVFMSVSEGKYPGLFSLSVLLLPFLRPLLFRLLDAAGHGELLILCGLFFALGVGAELFSLVGLKPDLGALIVGVLIASHPKAGELSKALFSFKELMLVGFFLSIGMQGLPSLSIVSLAVGLCLLLPLKTALYFFIIGRFGLRTRSSLLSSLTLANYSEFGLIVAAMSAAKGLLPVEWVLIIALAVSISFALASPFSYKAEQIYQRTRKRLKTFETAQVHPSDKIIDITSARVLVIGMGRIGGGAYDELAPLYENRIIGIEHNPARVDFHRERERNVLVGDASDTDFWYKLKRDRHLELILLAMPNHHNNIYAAHQIRNLGFNCKVVAVARYADEVKHLAELGVIAFNMYAEAGAGLAQHAIMEGVKYCSLEGEMPT